MKKSFLLSVIFALALVDFVLAGATYRLAIRDDAGHLLGTDPSVCYRYKVYNETRGEYTHDKDTTFAVSLIDGGMHNIEFIVETSVWQTGYPCDTNDVLRVEILNANEGNFPIGTITGLAPVDDFVTPILTPTIRATPTPTNPEGEEVDLIRLLADEDSYVNYSMYCAGVESYFGGGWKDDQDRDGDGLSDGLERMLGTDPYGGALSKEEVRQALKAAHLPDLARPNGFESDLTLTENGLVLAAFTHSVGHAYGLRWLRDFSDEGVCLELCDENRKLLGKKAQAVEIKEGMTATDQAIFGLLSDEQMASGCVALTVDGYIVETVELNVGPYDPVGVHVNGVDIGRGRGWGWTYTNEVLTLSGRYAYSLAGTNQTNDVRIEVKNPLSLTFNRLELTSSAAPITVGESAHLTIAGGSAKFVGGDVVSPVPVIVEGGSVSASLTDARSPDGRKLWRVKVPDVSEEGLLEFTGLPVDYRTNDIYALDGELSLWLPNGIYRFTVNGKRYYAAVADAEATALDYWPMFMYVDGRDIGCGAGEGWTYSEEFKTLAFTDCTSATLSGTNETSAVEVVTREDLELFFDRVKLVNEKNVFATYDDAKLTLAGGTAKLVGGSEGVVVSDRPIVVAGGSFFADLTNAVAPDGKKVWCVKVSELEAEGALALSGLPSYYRTDGIYAEDGKIALWLPDGIYRFTIDGVSYLAKVNGADVEAFKGDFIGLTVNGLDVAFGSDEGWALTDNLLKLTGAGPFVLSGADAAGRIGVVADTDTTVTFENLTLSSEKTPFEIAVNRSVRLLLKGDNRLTAKGDTCAALHSNMGSSLVIDRAEGLTDAEAKLIASGAKLGAGIGCGKWQLLGDIEIKGGTIEAIGGENGAGLGGGDGGGAGDVEDEPKRAEIVISGGVVTAQGGVDAAGIGCGMRSWGPQIVITGGRIKARGGKNSYSDIGSAFIMEGDITKSFTTINISGGTVDAARIGSTVESQSKAQNTITGGNIIANTVAPDPTNGTNSVYSVTITGLVGDEAIVFEGLPAGYGTNDIYAVDGKAMLWLPNGIYRFAADGKRRYAEVVNAATTVIDYWPMFMYVDGRDIGCGIGEGWAYSEEFKTLAFTNCTSATLSGTNETSAVEVVTREDLELFFDRVKLVNEKNVFAAYDDAKLTLAGGTATLIGGSEGVSSGSIVVAGGSFLADLTNAVAPDGSRAWRVTVSGLESREALALSGLPSYYRTDGIYAEDDKIALWLPDGIYRFTIDGVSYLAKVNGADVEAFKGDFIGLTVNGLDVAFGSDEGWALTDNLLKLTGAGPFVLSGADAAGRIGVVADTDTTVTFENLTLSSEKTPFEIAVNRSVRLLLKGDNRLTAKGDTCAALHPNMGSSLVIDRAEGLTDAEAKLIASGAKLGAGIGCGKWQLLGDIEIKGGTIEAIGGENGAGFGGGEGGGAGNEESDPKCAKLTISGGAVTAKGGSNAAGIGCGYSGWGLHILISGGRVTANGGKDADYDIGVGHHYPVRSSFTTITISGGTVDSSRIGSNETTEYFPISSHEENAKVTINGGSVIALNVSPNPRNGNYERIYRVAIDGLTGEGPIALAGLPESYGTNDIYAVRGKVFLWLPNGRYVFSIDGVPYLAKVNGINTTAQILNFFAVIRMGEDGHAIVEPSENAEGCSYSVIASEALDFKDAAILPIGRIEDPKYRFFRVRVE